MNYCKLFGRWSLVLGFLLAAFFISGCNTTSDSLPKSAGGAETAVPLDTDSTETIHIGDFLIIVFSDLPTLVPNFEVRVNEEGTITLIENQKFVAAGKTRGELEKEIRERYVPKYYVRMTVTIKPQERLYYVRGEVRQPGPKAYMGPITVLNAIASAGDFTDFANKKRVTLTHLNGKKQAINCSKAIKNPQLDLRVYPGDTIHVPRTIW